MNPRAVKLPLKLRCRVVFRIWPKQINPMVQEIMNTIRPPTLPRIDSSPQNHPRRMRDQKES
jgi:hypothetical protein